MYPAQLAIDTDGQVPADVDDDTLKSHIKRAILCSVFPSMPVEPMFSRWGKLFSSVQTFNLGWSVHGIMPMAFGLTFDPIMCDRLLAAEARSRASAPSAPPMLPPLPPPDAPPPTDDIPMDEVAVEGVAGADPMPHIDALGADAGMADVDVVDVDDIADGDDDDDVADGANLDTPANIAINRHRNAAHDDDVEGVDSREKYAAELKSRLRKSARNFRDPTSYFSIQLLTSVLGVYNWATAWFLQRSQDRSSDPLGLKTSAILDMKYAPVSPCLIMRQHISTMLCVPFSASPLAPLKRIVGQFKPFHVNKMHQILLSADGATHVRFEDALELTDPWAWLTLADRRRTAEHPSVRRTLANKRFCCTDRGATVTALRMMYDTCGGVDPAFFATDMFATIAEAPTRVIDGTTDDCEVRHARNRDACGSGNLTSEMLSTTNLLRESVSTHTAYTSDLNTLDDANSLVSADDGAMSKPKRGRWSGKLAFHVLRQAGTGVGLLCHGEWDTTHMAWDHQLDQAEKSQYQDIADLLNDGADFDSIIAHHGVTHVPQPGPDCIVDADADMPAPATLPVAFDPSMPISELALPLRDGRSHPLNVQEMQSSTQWKSNTEWLHRLARTTSCAAGINAAIMDRPAHPACAALMGLTVPPASADDDTPHVAKSDGAPHIADMWARINTTKRCQDVGICRACAGNAAYVRFNKTHRNTKRFVRHPNATPSAPNGHLTTPHVATMLMAFDGLTLAGEIVSTDIYWVGFANGSLAFQTWVRMKFIDDTIPTRPAPPYCIEPLTSEHVQSLLPVRTQFPGTVGRLVHRKSLRIINEMSTCTTTAHYRTTHLTYTPSILITDPDADPDPPLGRLRVDGEKATPEPVLVDPPRKKRVVAPGHAPKPKPAKPKHKTLAAKAAHPPPPVPPPSHGGGPSLSPSGGCHVPVSACDADSDASSESDASVSSDASEHIPGVGDDIEHELAAFIEACAVDAVAIDKAVAGCAPVPVSSPSESPSHDLSPDCVAWMETTGGNVAAIVGMSPQTTKIYSQQK